MTVMDPEPEEIDVQFLTEQDVRNAIDQMLSELALTAEDVRLQAARQDFSSPLAHKLWIGYGDLL